MCIINKDSLKIYILGQNPFICLLTYKINLGTSQLQKCFKIHEIRFCFSNLDLLPMKLGKNVSMVLGKVAVLDMFYCELDHLLE